MSEQMSLVEKFDTLIAGYLTTLSDEDEKTLLAYSLNLHRAWRQLLRRVPLQDQLNVLDVGTGFGLLPLEIARDFGANIWASDISSSYIARARTLYEHSVGVGLIRPDAKLHFEVADIHSLPNLTESMDLICVREVFSYVTTPSKAASELFRVLRPGGTIIVEDIDDHLYLTYPPSSPAMKILHGAITNLQSRAGDREVGRKLSSYLADAGFSISWIDIPIEAMHRDSDPTLGEKSFIIAQISAVRSRLIDGGILSEHEYERAMEELANEPPRAEFRMNGRVAVLATKPS